MNLDEIKKQIEGANFSEEARLALIDILEKSIIGSELKVTPENKEKLLGIVDLELERNQLEINMRQEVASALEEFGSTILSAVDQEKSSRKEQNTS